MCTAIFMHIPSLLNLPSIPTPHPHPTPLGHQEHQPELPVLDSGFLLAISFTQGSVYHHQQQCMYVNPNPHLVPPSPPLRVVY